MLNRVKKLFACCFAALLSETEILNLLLYSLPV